MCIRDSLVGVPLFLLIRGRVPTSAAALIMVFAMLPGFLLALYERQMCIRDRPVGDHQNRFVPGQGLKGLLDLMLVLRVGESGSLVPISTTSANPHKYGTFQKI